MFDIDSKKPTTLDDVGKERYAELVTELKEKGHVFCRTDVDRLEQYAYNYQNIVRMKVELNNSGGMILRTTNGMKQRNPLVAMIAQLERENQVIARAYGLGQSHIKPAQSKAKPKNKLLGFTPEKG